jgi:hypothetical protein
MDKCDFVICGLFNDRKKDGCDADALKCSTFQEAVSKKAELTTLKRELELAYKLASCRDLPCTSFSKELRDMCSVSKCAEQYITDFINQAQEEE